MIGMIAAFTRYMMIILMLIGFITIAFILFLTVACALMNIILKIIERNAEDEM